MTLCWGAAAVLGWELREEQRVALQCIAGFSYLWAHACAGVGWHGALGNGKGTGLFDVMRHVSSTPVKVLGDQSFVTTCAGWDSSCALDLLGNAWCWGEPGTGMSSVQKPPLFCVPLIGLSCTAGDNGYGKLGVGQDMPLYKAAAPEKVVGDHTFRSIACGNGHTCALDANNKAWCWGEQDCCPTLYIARQCINSPRSYCSGNNMYGQLGTGNNMDASTPVEAATGHTWLELSTGDDFTCALEPGGNTFCWGKERLSSSGVARAESESARDARCRVKSFASVFPPLWIAGDNQYGQLGAGLDASNSSVPVKVAGGHTFRSVSCGLEHACALDGEDIAWCWGVRWKHWIVCPNEQTAANR